MDNIIQSVKKYLLYLVIFIFPFFFLNTTQEYFITNKFYLLIFSVFVLLLLSTTELIITKKLVWVKNPFDNIIALLFTTVVLSTLISSPNKIQALLNPTFGVMSILGLVLLYYYISRSERPIILEILSFSSIIISIFTVALFFQPFKNINLPEYLSFLKDPLFTPLGSQLDLVIFLGFILIVNLGLIIESYLRYEPKNDINREQIFNIIVFFSTLIGLFTSLYLIFKSPQSNMIFPPFNISWYAFVETLKNPLTAVFGIGVDNFASIFTKVKDIGYNQSNLWQINFFSVSRSALLHIFTETGLLSIIVFTLLISQLFRTLKEIFNQQGRLLLIVLIYIIFVLLFLPPSLISFFLLFIFLGLTSNICRVSHQQSKELQNLDLKKFLPVYMILIIVAVLIIAVTGYFTARAYLAEFNFKKSLDGLAKNNAKVLYDNQRQAIIINPYMEKYRINFSRTNLLLANNIAQKINQPTQQGNKSIELTDQDKQTIAQAIQSAISEAKAAIALNPNKANNWENLALIYRNIFNLVQNADAWAISSYQRAIVLDPQNPIYRLNLGGVYYSLNKYQDAINYFEQVIILKPNWANAYYNLAWAAYQNGNYERAVNAMASVVQIVTKSNTLEDLAKAKKELEQFKQKLKTQNTEEGVKTKQSDQLSLPTPPSQTLNPKLTLPKTASPEGK